MDLSGLMDDFCAQWEETVGCGLENDGDLNQGDTGGDVSGKEGDLMWLFQLRL